MRLENIQLGRAIQELVAQGKALSKCQAAGHPTGQWGTKGSGLAAPPPGKSFHCADCAHYVEEMQCDHGEVLKDPQAKKDPKTGLAEIAHDWCCAWWWPKGFPADGNQLPDYAKRDAELKEQEKNHAEGYKD